MDKIDSEISSGSKNKNSLSRKFKKANSLNEAEQVEETLKRYFL
jgi:hypothetical protein